MPTNLQRLLNPKTIAVVGGKMAAAVIQQCDKIGYAGELWAVNPKRDTLEGRKCYPSVLDLPSAPDATFIAVPREATIVVVGQLAAMGAGGAVCYASGFAEVGAEGLIYDEQLRTAMGDLAIVGPNCYGVLNYFDGVTLWPDEHGGKVIERGVAIVAQSGNISISMSMQQRSLPLGYLIATGNKSGVTIPEYIETLLEDERVSAIGLYIEALENVAEFSCVAIRALEKNVPIVVLKSGASQLGQAVTLSHTSALAGSDALYDALFDRCGVLRVRSIPDLLETLKLLSLLGPLPNNQFASISSSGGEAALIADKAATLGLQMPAIVGEQYDRLHAVLGKRVAIGNPLDYHTYIWGDTEAQQECFAGVAEGSQAVTIKILDFPRPDICDPTLWVETAEAFCKAIVSEQTNGIVMATLHENLPLSVQALCLEYGIAPMLGLDECLRAIAGAAWVYEKQLAALPSPLADVVSFPSEPYLLDEAESKQLLANYGIDVPISAVSTGLVVSETNGSRSSEITPSSLTHNIPYPVALKLLSNTIAHKTEVGGVRLNIANDGELGEAMAQMTHLGDRFLIEAMAPQPLAELILGITRDPQFGLVLVIGAGGVLVELFRDSVQLLLPVTAQDVADALDRLKIAPLLNGYRGGKSADKNAIITAALNLARFAEEHADTLVEVDINPLFVYADGVLAVDAVIRKS